MQQRRSLLGLNAWERHCKLMADWQTYYGESLPEQPRTVKTDYDTLAEQHRCVLLLSFCPESRRVSLLRWFPAFYRQVSPFEKPLPESMWNTHSLAVAMQLLYCLSLETKVLG